MRRHRVPRRAKDAYYYSSANMSDNYAMIAQLIEDKDLCAMVAEMVRFTPASTPAPPRCGTSAVRLTI